MQQVGRKSLLLAQRERENKIMVLQELSITVCTEIMAWNVLRNGMSMFLQNI